MKNPKFRAAAASLVLAGALGLTAGATSMPAHSAQGAVVGVVDVSIDDKRRITMPETIQPGVNSFEVTTAHERGSSFQLVQLDEGYTLEQAVEDVEKGLNGGNLKALKRFERNVTLLGGAEVYPDAPATVVVALPAGSYYALDVRQNKASKWFDFTAEGEDTGAAMPEGAQVRAKDSTTWAGKPKSIPRKGMLTVKNAADQNHFAILAKFRKGKGIRDFKQWIKSGAQSRPPVSFRHSTNSGVVSPGISSAFNYRLPAGRYVLTCFWPDASMGGMPHAFMGMYRAIRLTR